MSEWHVCTAQRLQKRFNVADMLFCLFLYMSFLISSMDKQLECAPSKPLQLIRKAEEQNDADLKMSAGVAFLIVHSLYSTHWCA